MNIELVLSPALYEGRQLKEHHAVVAVDILRATTAICTAFQAGAYEVVPLTSLDALPYYAQQGYTLAAERNGLKVHGAKCGNSPTEYMSMDLRGQRVAYSTTNGTVSIVRSANSDFLTVGAFSNLSVLADFLAKSCPFDNLVLLCSGWNGDPCIEDTLFCGALIGRLQALGKELSFVNDASMVALDMWQCVSDRVAEYCSKATHVQRLLRLGYAKDIQFAFRIDTCPVLPVYVASSKSLKIVDIDTGK